MDRFLNLLKEILHIITNRITLYICAMLIQLVILIIVILEFGNYFIYFYALNVILSMFVVISILNGNSNPAYKIAWIIPILLLPIFGGLIYLMFGKYKTSKKVQLKMKKINDEMKLFLNQENEVKKSLKNKSIIAFNQSQYIQKYAHCPVYRNSTSEFFSIGEEMFQSLIKELQKAKRYIFMEYFIIEEGIMWNTILSILEQKAKEGVDVRIIYDDIGCFFKLPYKYNEKLESKGIKCCVFNPFVPILSLRHNNRDHRKITVIDGHTAYTGGINLADEYINEVERFGHWKDTAIMIKGDAAWSFTVFFLSLWEYLTGEEQDFELFRPLDQDNKNYQNNGFIQPFTDSPIDEELVSETIYLNLFNQAKKYIYINTPYLILDNEIQTSLTSAAKRGVDVRIITPHIPDKWYVHEVTRSNYSLLLESGVKIYEYTLGFNHAKTFIVDDQLGVVGTANLDYRSLYLHFECGVWLYDTKSIQDIKKDFLKTIEESQQITFSYCASLKWYKKLRNAILRVFAPLM